MFLVCRSSILAENFLVHFLTSLTEFYKVVKCFCDTADISPQDTKQNKRISWQSRNLLIILFVFCFHCSNSLNLTRNVYTALLQVLMTSRPWKPGWAIHWWQLSKSETDSALHQSFTEALALIIRNIAQLLLSEHELVNTQGFHEITESGLLRNTCHATRSPSWNHHLHGFPESNFAFKHPLWVTNRSPTFSFESSCSIGIGSSFICPVSAMIWGSIITKLEVMLTVRSVCKH